MPYVLLQCLLYDPGTAMEIKGTANETANC